MVMGSIPMESENRSNVYLESIVMQILSVLNPKGYNRANSESLLDSLLEKVN